jgi:penicillin-binding protein 2
MINNTNKNLVQILNRRIFIIFITQASILLVLIYRLFVLQIAKHNFYENLSSNNHIRTIVEPVPRGQILDKNNQILANNIYEYLLIIDSKKIINLSDFIHQIDEIFNLNDEEKDLIINNLKKKKRFINFKSISFEEFIHFQYQIDHMPEILITRKYLRIYPYDKAAAHIVGYVTNENKKYDNDYFIYSNDFKIGRIGIEKLKNDELAGENQISQISVDARGNKIREVDTIVGKPGDNIKTSINGELQKMIFDEFSAVNASGSAIVIDIEKHQLTAMVSAPSFNPEIFNNEALKKQLWEKLATDETHPLINKGISGLYSPGSTFKVVVALAALELGIIDKNTTIFCNGGHQVGNRFYHCLHYHGSINVHDAIIKSCNSFFYALAKKMDIGFLEKLSISLGFGSISNLQLEGEYKGIVPSKLWKLKRFSSLWYIGDTANLMIGQGYLSCNPLQLCTATASIASGNLIKLSILDDNFNTNPIEKNQLITEKNLQIIRKAMFDVVNVQGGTSYYSIGLHNKDLNICGKTGTVQISSGKKHKNHSLFIGFAPYENPKYAISIVGELMGYGASFSAPIAGKIFRTLLGIENNN